MAGKARRVASRQAQLSRKRKKQQKVVAGPLSTVRTPTEVDGKHAESSTARVVEPTSPPPISAAVPAMASAVASQPAPVAAVPRRARGERAATRNYIGAELRRILLLAATVLFIIVVLGILL